MFYLVLGAGISGIGACNLLVKQNKEVILYDKDKTKLYSIYKAKLIDKSIILCAKLNKIDIKEIECIVVSPGVKISGTMHRKIQRHNISIISEIELAAQCFYGSLIAITGTNGKTTTTLLTTHIFNCVNKNAVAVGNVGRSFCEVAINANKEDILVCEASSFQLQNIKTFKPKISAFLNFAPDHLNVHSTLNEYLNSKKNIFKNQTNDDYILLNYDDKIVMQCAKETPSKVVYFSVKKILKDDYKYCAYIVRNIIYIKLNTNTFEIPINNKIQSLNAYNVIVASVIALLYGVNIKDIISSISSFNLPPHRCEFVISKNGVEYINDSKATNIHATLNAIKTFSKPIILLLGGSNKGENFKQLFDNLTPNIKHIVAFGKTGKNIFKLSKRYNKAASYIYNFESAVKKAQCLATFGDIVLLSPACASFDQFSNYSQRGDYFKYLVSGETFEGIK